MCGETFGKKQIVGRGGGVVKYKLTILLWIFFLLARFIYSCLQLYLVIEKIKVTVCIIYVLQYILYITIQTMVFRFTQGGKCKPSLN